jgi:signal transduction histidine kinase
MAEVQRIVRNLLDNALAHAESVVELRVSNGAGGARLDVVDDGADVAAEERDRKSSTSSTAATLLGLDIRPAAGSGWP